MNKKRRLVLTLIVDYNKLMKYGKVTEIMEGYCSNEEKQVIDDLTRLIHNVKPKLLKSMYFVIEEERKHRGTYFDRSGKMGSTSREGREWK
jgi:hypothetical protein